MVAGQRDCGLYGRYGGYPRRHRLLYVWFQGTFLLSRPNVGSARLALLAGLVGLGERELHLLVQDRSPVRRRSVLRFAFLELRLCGPVAAGASDSRALVCLPLAILPGVLPDGVDRYLAARNVYDDRLAPCRPGSRQQYRRLYGHYAGSSSVVVPALQIPQPGDAVSGRHYGFPHSIARRCAGLSCGQPGLYCLCALALSPATHLRFGQCGTDAGGYAGERLVGAWHLAFVSTGRGLGAHRGCPQGAKMVHL